MAGGIPEPATVPESRREPSIRAAGATPRGSRLRLWVDWRRWLGDWRVKVDNGNPRKRWRHRDNPLRDVLGDSHFLLDLIDPAFQRIEPSGQSGQLHQDLP